MDVSGAERDRPGDCGEGEEKEQGEYEHESDVDGSKVGG